jgi:L-alanine-DL-glutamate epimerase-like enolase superfamily enzyme
MDGRMYGNHGAKAAVEIALHDLPAVARESPCIPLLGEKKRSRMPLLGVIAAAIRRRPAGRHKEEERPA